MDRVTYYVGEIPRCADFLQAQQYTMIANGMLTAALFGNNTIVNGLACTPTTPASMQVNVGPGMITQIASLETNAWSSLPQDVADTLVKTGINIASTTFTLTAPTLSGQSINYLIEAQYQESDVNQIVLPYYNATNPSQAYLGQGNNGVAQPTARVQRVSLQLKAGPAGNTGTQSTPGVDPGWTGLYVITVNFGMTSITAAAITTLASAPFLQWNFQQSSPGFSRIATFGTAGTYTWVVPAGVTKAKVTVTGAGGGGCGSSLAGGGTFVSGGGGGAGGTAIGVISGLTPGASISVTVGGGGAGAGASVNATGGTGGSSSFGTFMSATGGIGATWGSSQGSNGGAGGGGSGGQINLTGGYGTDGMSGAVIGMGNAGGSYWGGGVRGGTALGGVGGNGSCPGTGGGGTYNNNGTGGNGASGAVIIEY